MRVFRSSLIALTILAVSMAASAAGPAPTVVTPAQVKWAPQPGNFSMAVLYGDPSKSGFYVMRLKLPPNWTFPAHYHPRAEHVTILSGTFYAGLGNKVNKNAATGYTAGTFVSLPAGVRHYAFTRSSGAVIQIDGEGPSRNVMVKM